MESSRNTGDDGEGCNSSESGWTMYLASPMHGDDDGGGKGSGSEGSNVDDGYGYINGRESGKKYEDDGGDDDSLASDASTGPTKVKAPSMPDGKQEEGHRKNGDDDDDNGEEDDEEEEDDIHTKISTSSCKKAGKAEKGREGKSSRRDHSKRGSSSRTSFFW